MYSIALGFLRCTIKKIQYIKYVLLAVVLSIS